MAFNEQLADRIREALMDQPDVEEKRMFGGLCFMVDGKMCVGVLKDDMMCRIDPEIELSVLEKQGCRQMDFTRRHMKGYVYVDETGRSRNDDFRYWIGLCLDFNKRAKPAAKRKKADKDN